MDDDIEVEAIAIVEEDDDVYHSPKTLFRLALWANILAWVIPVIEIVFFGIKIYFNFVVNRQPGTPIFYSVANVISYLSPVAAAIGWFILLKAVSEGIYLLVDIYEKE